MKRCDDCNEPATHTVGGVCDSDYCDRHFEEYKKFEREEYIKNQKLQKEIDEAYKKELEGFLKKYPQFEGKIKKRTWMVINLSGGPFRDFEYCIDIKDIKEGLM